MDCSNCTTGNKKGLCKKCLSKVETTEVKSDFDIKLLLKLAIFAFGVLFFVAAGSHLLQINNLEEWYFQIGMVIPLLVCIILWTRIWVNLIGD